MTDKKKPKDGAKSKRNKLLAAGSTLAILTAGKKVADICSPDPETGEPAC